MDGPTSDESPSDSGNPTEGRDRSDGCEARSGDNHAIPDAELFKSAVEQLRFVTTMFWQQAGFFLLIQSGLITVVSQSILKGEEKPAPLLGLSFLGLALAGFWGWVAWKRVKIIKYWRSHVVGLDQLIYPHRLLYKNLERDLDEDPLSRPTSVTKFLPIVLALFWVVLLVTGIIWLLASTFVTGIIWLLTRSISPHV